MSVTEEEAKTKICHVTFARSADNGGRGQVEFCEGAQCMSWRWQDGTFVEYGKLKVRDVSGYIVDAKGFCGLAGKP